MAQPEGNVRIREGEEGDWAHARRVFERGASYRQVEAEVDGRLTYSRIRRMALAEGWTQGEVKSTSTLEERPLRRRPTSSSGRRRRTTSYRT